MPAKIDYTAWRFWVDMANLAWGLAVCIYVWFQTRRKDIDQKFKTVGNNIKAMGTTIGERCERQCQRIDDLEKKDIAIESKVDSMPGHNEVKELSDRINVLQGTISELNGRLGGINRAVDLLNEHHINGGNSIELIEAINKVLSAAGKEKG